VLHSVEGGAGRPHREEAMLIQVVGEENEKGERLTPIETDRNLLLTLAGCLKCHKKEGAFLTCVSVLGVKRGGEALFCLLPCAS